ncbi:MAG: hypothetical protein ABEJ85_01420 [Haloarculaceae archaeon]
MSSDTDGGLTDQGKLLFGAGFVFGVMVTLLILAVVLVVVRYESSLAAASASRLLTIVVAGALFSGIVGAGLYFLAFQRNRTKIPIDSESFAGFPPEEDALPPEDGTERTGDDGTDDGGPPSAE